MERALSIVRWLVPVAVGAATLAICIPAGLGGTLLVLAGLTGALLGLAIVKTFEGVLSMAGLLAGPRRASHRRLQLLERDRLTLLRSIEEIDLDASQHRLDPDEAAALAAPLRARAARLERALERPEVEEQIERALCTRLQDQSQNTGAER